MQEKGDSYHENFEFEVPFGTLILDNVVLKFGRGLSWEVQIFRIVNRCVADRALDIDAIVQNILDICKENMPMTKGNSINYKKEVWQKKPVNKSQGENVK